MLFKVLFQRALNGVPIALALVALGLVLGTVANVVSPRRIAWVEDWSHFVEARAYREGLTLINTAEAQQLWQKGTHLFLDARSPRDFEAGRIPGAFSLPYAAISEHLGPLQGLLTPRQPLVAYCSGVECDESLLLAIELRRMGFTNVVLYAGGIQKWREAGYPVEEGP
jgi:rhodanese-related sulfurtransferase